MKRFRSLALLLMSALSAASSSSSFASQSTYLVSDEVTSLGEISILLYGTLEQVDSIARCNRIAPPYPIRQGQTLKLCEPPTLTREEGRKRVVQMWIRMFSRREPPVTATANEPAQAQVEAERDQGYLQAMSVLEAQPPKDPELAAIESPFSERAQAAFERGKARFQASDFENAALSFRQARQSDSSLLEAWFYEIRTLTHLNRQDEVSVVKAELLKERPELQSLPMFQGASQ